MVKIPQSKLMTTSWGTIQENENMSIVQIIVRDNIQNLWTFKTQS